MATLERAIKIACDAHAGQTDKAGEVYILHPLRVMLSFESPEHRMAAILHDVVEDSDVTLEFLKKEGFSSVVIEAVAALTRREGEDYLDFVRRASDHPVARAVKRADLMDNLDLSRLPEPTKRDQDRVERYRKALALLEEPA